jgi:hypothetical protein
MCFVSIKGNLSTIHLDKVSDLDFIKFESTVCISYISSLRLEVAENNILIFSRETCGNFNWGIKHLENY